MDFFIVILLFIKLGLVFCIVIVPALACGGFAALGWSARRVRDVRLGVAMQGVAVVGVLQRRRGRSPTARSASCNGR